MPRARREEEKLVIRASIMDGAARAFLRTGYRAATMQDIAAEAGCTPPTLYAYFSGKRGIFDALVSRSVDAILAALDRPPLPAQPFEARLERLLRDLYATCEAQRDSFLYFTRVSRHREYGPTQASTAPLTRLEDRWARFMAELQAETGCCAHYPPDVLSVAFFSLVGGFMERWAMDDGQSSLQDEIPLVMHLFLQGVTAPPPGPRQ